MVKVYEIFGEKTQEATRRRKKSLMQPSCHELIWTSSIGIWRNEIMFKIMYCNKYTYTVSTNNYKRMGECNDQEIDDGGLYQDSGTLSGPILFVLNSVFISSLDFAVFLILVTDSEINQLCPSRHSNPTLRWNPAKLTRNRCLDKRAISSLIILRNEDK